MFQDIANYLDEGDSIDAIIIDFFKAFDLDPQDWLLTKLAASGVDPRVIVWVREFLVDRTQRVRVRGGGTIQGSKSNPRCAASERFGPTIVSSVRK